MAARRNHQFGWHQGTATFRKVQLQLEHPSTDREHRRRGDTSAPTPNDLLCLAARLHHDVLIGKPGANTGDFTWVWPV